MLVSTLNQHSYLNQLTLVSTLNLAKAMLILSILVFPHSHLNCNVLVESLEEMVLDSVWGLLTQKDKQVVLKEVVEGQVLQEEDKQVVLKEAVAGEVLQEVVEGQVLAEVLKGQVLPEVVEGQVLQEVVEGQVQPEVVEGQVLQEVIHS
ncbi:uncharacterized protein LOC131317044 [Rhododendron vialii]|uniref:uncharacterized protein LOC131317044 n=1 Tax=Rhododendron vialii TaxID=182163 RepID=UPI00265DED17|nr:uncharacterized protein LOC131317044 [Rhododendron vialii]